LIRDAGNFLTVKRSLILSKIYKNENNVIAVQLFKKYRLNPDEYINNDLTISPNGFILLNEYVKDLDIDDFVKNMYELITEISRIIDASPKPTNRFRVYRGVKNDYISETDDNHGLLSGFQSMSYSIKIALGFSGSYSNLEMRPMLYTFDIGPDTPCIAMEGISYFPQEKEILVNMNLYGNILNYFLEKIHLNRDNYTFNTLIVSPHPFTSIYNKIIQLLPMVYENNNINNAFISRKTRYSITSNNNSNTNRSRRSNTTNLNNAINAALNSWQYGGRLAITNNSLRNTRKIRNNRLKKIEPNKTMKNINTKQANKAKMNVDLKKEYNNYLQLQKKESTMNYTEIRDPGLGFIIVKDKKVPKAVMNAFKKLNANK
jgi:hypothetical protein